MARSLKISPIAFALALAFLPGSARADSSQAQDRVVLSKGVRGRIQGPGLRPAKLVFTDSAVTVEVDGETSERFEYTDLQVHRARVRIRLPLFDKTYWLMTLPQVPMYFLTGPYFLAGSLGASHALILPRWLKSRGTEQWLSLHSNQAHRCSHIVLPRKKRFRMAILEELASRGKRELRVRPPDHVSLRD